jgi:signal transduction histidine kinase
MENLLRNAIDAMEQGVGVITVRVSKEPGYACVEVTDTGKGIPANKFRTIFKPGYSTKTRGWGLGLSLSLRIIADYHKGRLFVRRSEIDRGSTFALLLPL